MSEDDFDDDGFARPPRPLRPKGKRVKIHQHSQHTIVEFDGPYGPIHIEFLDHHHRRDRRGRLTSVCVLLEWTDVHYYCVTILPLSLAVMNQ